MRPTATSSREQSRVRALAHANEIRRARAELKRKIANCELSAAQVIVVPPAAVLRWPVAELLISQPHWGRQKCKRFLARNDIGELKPVGALTERQRRVLAEQLLNDRPVRSA